MKKILILLVSLIAIFGLVSCNGENTSPSSDDTIEVPEATAGKIDEEVYNAMKECINSAMSAEEISCTITFEYRDSSGNTQYTLVYDEKGYTINGILMTDENAEVLKEAYLNFIDSEACASGVSTAEYKCDYIDEVRGKVNFSLIVIESQDLISGIGTSGANFSYSSSNVILNGSDIYEFEVWMNITRKSEGTITSKECSIKYNGDIYDASEYDYFGSLMFSD